MTDIDPELRDDKPGPPGGTLLTRLKVYDAPCADGQRGGTPHLHLACTEMYYALSGSGAVETIDTHGFKRTELRANDVLIFTAGTLHRLVCGDGGLEVLIVMQNCGLPERGDNIPVFAHDILSDANAFADAMCAENLEEAIQRRDLAVEGFLELKTKFERSTEVGREALNTIYRQGASLTKRFNEKWYDSVTHGAFSEAQNSLHEILALGRGNIRHLQGATQSFIPGGDCTRPGFCGTLNRYWDAASLANWALDGPIAIADSIVGGRTN